MIAGHGHDARVEGVFAMAAHVTAAVNVPGEHAGQTLHRTWLILPLDCHASTCTRLALVRRRSAGIENHLILHRTGRGRYAGSGSFLVPLRCNGRVYRRGSRAPYRITLRVTRSVIVEGIRFARAIAATYVNAHRSDATPCPLGPTRDAARYDGRDTTPAPTPPVAAFTDEVDAATRTVSFTDTSHPGVVPAPIVSTAWNFGEPSSAAGDTSKQTNPTHQYAAPGTYTVMLTVTDANDLHTTVTQTVTIPPPLLGVLPPASRARRPRR